MSDCYFVKDKDTKVVLFQGTIKNGLYQLLSPFGYLKLTKKSELLICQYCQNKVSPTINFLLQNYGFSSSNMSHENSMSCSDCKALYINKIDNFV